MRLLHKAAVQCKQMTCYLGMVLTHHFPPAPPQIADRGVRTLSKLLDKSLVLSILDLKDNQIHGEGARALARAAKRSPCLLSLNLRLNRLGDDGCKAVLDSLQKNSQLQRLNLSANAGASHQQSCQTG